MDISCKELVGKSSGDEKRRDVELVSIIVRKVVIVDTRTGEIIWSPRSSESFYLNGSTSRDAKGYNVKKSLSDGVLEIRNYTHVTKTANLKISEIKDFQDGKSAEGNELSHRMQNNEARAARLKQIKDFFSDPVDRELFPKQEPEPPRIRKIPPQKIQPVKESVDKMLAQFTCTVRDENYMEEVYQYRVFPRPQLGKVPSATEMLPSPTELGSPPPGQKSPPPLLVLPPTDKIPMELSRIHGDLSENQNDQMIMRTEYNRDNEKSAHRPSWFERLFCCCGATSNSKKNKVRQELGNEKKKGWIRTKLRKIFQRT